jgi:hypothetical protein
MMTCLSSNSVTHLRSVIDETEIRFLVKQETYKTSFKSRSSPNGEHKETDPILVTCCRPYTHLQTWTKSNPLSVSLEAQCLSSSPLSPQLELLPSRLTPREAKGVDPSYYVSD